jgi:hypothetical protein
MSRSYAPQKEALAAVLQFLGGVLPPHMGVNPTGNRVIHDWLWSVGAHPLSVTSTGEQVWSTRNRLVLYTLKVDGE